MQSDHAPAAVSSSWVLARAQSGRELPALGPASRAAAAGRGLGRVVLNGTDAPVSIWALPDIPIMARGVAGWGTLCSFQQHCQGQGLGSHPTLCHQELLAPLSSSDTVQVPFQAEHS